MYPEISFTRKKRNTVCVMSLGNDELYLARRAGIKLNIAERDNSTVLRRKEGGGTGGGGERYPNKGTGKLKGKEERKAEGEGRNESHMALDIVRAHERSNGRKRPATNNDSRSFVRALVKYRTVAAP